MQPLAIVSAFDEFKDGSSRLSFALEYSTRALGFECSEETLHDSIIVASACPAYTHLALQIGQCRHASLTPTVETVEKVC
jgi:hypothetical protein